MVCWAKFGNKWMESWKRSWLTWIKFQSEGFCNCSNLFLQTLHIQILSVRSFSVLSYKESCKLSRKYLHLHSCNPPWWWLAWEWIHSSSFTSILSFLVKCWMEVFGNCLSENVGQNQFAHQRTSRPSWYHSGPAVTNFLFLVGLMSFLCLFCSYCVKIFNCSSSNVRREQTVQFKKRIFSAFKK